MPLGDEFAVLQGQREACLQNGERKQGLIGFILPKTVFSELEKNQKTEEKSQQSVGDSPFLKMKLNILEESFSITKIL